MGRLPAEEYVPGGKYVLDRDVTVDGRMSLEGDTWLVLCDGMTLDVKGLSVPDDSMLFVYAESAGTGRIVSHAAAGAGIGGLGGSVAIHGGTVVAEGNSGCVGIGGSAFADCRACRKYGFRETVPSPRMRSRTVERSMSLRRRTEPRKRSALPVSL